MNFDITINPVDASHVQIICERSIAMEISDNFTFMVPNARYMQKFKDKIWDGKIRLFNMMNQTIYTGLVGKIKQFAAARDYSICDNTPGATNVSLVELDDFIKSLNLPFDLHYFQKDAIVHCTRNRRGVILSPTASGKSLILYVLSRMIGANVLIVVDSVSLVHQIKTDFIDYGCDPYDIHLIYQGQDTEVNRAITITTWQSIVKLKKAWFKRFKAVFGDEVHLFAAASLKKVMESVSEASFRVGFTGTLDGSETNELVLEGLFGPVLRVATTSELIDKGYLSPFRIKAIVLKHSEESAALVKKMDFAEEIDFIVTHNQRNKFVRNLALSLKGNTLVLFRFVERHGKVLYDDIVEHNKVDRKIYFIHGGVPGEERNKIRLQINNEDNSITVASVGSFSKGVNVPKLHNVIFASSFKSSITVLQSIGRSLRKSDGKDMATLFDIADDLTHNPKNKLNPKPNITLRHFHERVGVYDESGFNYKIYNVDL